jgi:hypothetical protein|tara:strand:- start:1328 stop:1804 length:477 start_codon:yes stop_codon:yes gene_type:complete
MRKYQKEKIAYNKGYRVTNEGDAINSNNKKVGYILNSGYEHFTINYETKHLKVATHRLQAYQKYGLQIYKQGVVVRHLNNNRFDNSKKNIAIGTHRENSLDIPKQKRIEMARHAGTKYSQEKINQIKDFYKKCRSYKETMNVFSLTSKGTLHHIINKR